MDSNPLSFQFQALEQVSDAVITVDLSGVIRFWNAAALRLFGYRKDESEGKKWKELLRTPQNTLDNDWPWGSRPGEGSWSGELQFSHKEGWALNLESSVEIIRDGQGGKNGFLVVGRLAKEASDLSRESAFLRQSFYSLAGQVSAIVVRLDPQGRIIYLNRSSVRDPEQRILGQSLRSFVSPENSLKVAQIIQEVKSTLQSRSYESSAVRADGEKRWYSGIFTPEIVDGELRTILVVADDITERKRVELQNAVALRIADSFNRESPDLEDIFAEIHRELEAILPAANMYVALKEINSSQLVLRYYSNKVLALDKDGPQPLELSHWVMEKGQAVLFNKEEMLEIGRKEGLNLPDFLPLHWMAVPLKNPGGTIGLIALQSYSEANSFHQNDLELLNFVSAQIGTLLVREMARVEIEGREKYFRALLDNSADIIFVVAEDLSILFVSPSITEMGYTQASLIGMDASETIHPEDQQEVRQQWQHLLASGGKSDSVIHRIFKKDGSIAFLESVGRYIPEIGKAIINCRDITFRLETEARNRVQADIIESSYDAIVGLDHRMRINSWNSGAELILGYKADEVIGTNGTQMIPEAFRVRDKELLKVVFQTGTGYTNIETIRESKDGRHLFLNSTISPVSNQKGEITGVSIIAKDLTDQKKLLDQLNQSLREKDVLLKEVHHRVKNNLQIISSLLLLEKEEISDPEVRNIFSRTEQRIRALFLMHEKLYQAPDLAQIDFKVYLEDLVHNLSVTFAQLSGEVEIKMECGEVLLDINQAIPCAMIVNELLSNSLKHAFAPGAKGRIEIRLKIVGAEDRHGFMEIRDNGTGLPEGFKIEESSSLGLSLVKALSEQINADFVYRNDHGAVFFIDFPLQNEN